METTGITSTTTSKRSNYADSSDTHNDDDSNHNPSLLFGTLNQDIADFMYQSIQKQLKRSLQALPILHDDSTERMELLYQYLLKHYITAVDLIELYNTRNTFSIRMIQPASRQTQVLELYRTYIETNHTGVWNDADWVCTNTGSTGIEDAMEIDGVDDDVNDMPSSVDDIPTAVDMQRVQTEITTLYDRLQQVQQQHTSLTNEMATVQALQEQQRDILPTSTLMNMKDTITNHISQTVPVVQTLRECQNTSFQLQQQMTIIEQQREDQKENLNEIVVVPPNSSSSVAVAPPPKIFKTIQERYEQDSAMVRPTGPNSSHITGGDATAYRPDATLAAVLTNLRGTNPVSTKTTVASYTE
jgi:hypothetical protein